MKRFDGKYTTLPDLAEALNEVRDEIHHDDRLIAIEFLSAWGDFKDATDNMRRLMRYYGISLKDQEVFE